MNKNSQRKPAIRPLLSRIMPILLLSFAVAQPAAQAALTAKAPKISLPIARVHGGLGAGAFIQGLRLDQQSLGSTNRDVRGMPSLFNVGASWNQVQTALKNDDRTLPNQAPSAIIAQDDSLKAAEKNAPKPPGRLRAAINRLRSMAKGISVSDFQLKSAAFKDVLDNLNNSYDNAAKHPADAEGLGDPGNTDRNGGLPGLILDFMRSSLRPGDVLDRKVLRAIAHLAQVQGIAADDDSIKTALRDLAQRHELAALANGLFMRTDFMLDQGLPDSEMEAGMLAIRAISQPDAGRALFLLTQALSAYDQAAPAQASIHLATLRGQAALLEKNAALAFLQLILKKGLIPDANQEWTEQVLAWLRDGNTYFDHGHSPQPLAAAHYDQLIGALDTLAPVHPNALLQSILTRLKAILRHDLPAHGSLAAAGSAQEQQDQEPAEIKAKIEARDMPDEVKKRALKELANMEHLPPGSEQRQKIQDYLSVLTDLPWNARSEDQLDLQKAKTILENSHFGLESVKKRVLEFLAVRMSNQRQGTGSNKGAILCFDGPPGTGKTSIVKAIAAAMGRKYSRLALGGDTDVSTLRGHRRTYQDSKYGSIIQMILTAGTKNPVIVLDEVDKLGRDPGKGDPSSALLEILDPEQNNTFQDRYLGVPFDLSEVLFVVTSNEKDNIPAALRDRLEIIDFTGYTDEEKVSIARDFIVPEKLEVTGLSSDNPIQLDAKAILRIIRGYTSEAGVRKLREKIEQVFRDIVYRRELGIGQAPAQIQAGDVEKYLGRPLYKETKAAENKIGVVTGLAVSGNGNGTLTAVEASIAPGHGKIALRKKMQKMADDSAQDVIAYIKREAEKLGIDREKLFERSDIDINFTTDADVDGPSAGITMLTALVSAATKRQVKAGIAMTGKMSMMGDVLPIGGLVQKAMAAHRQGLNTILFPAGNSDELEDLPEELRESATFKLIPVTTVEQALELALEPPQSQN